MKLPDTPVGRQLAWVLDCIHSGGKATIEEIEEHFAPAFLGATPAASVQRVLRTLADRGLASFEVREDPYSPYALRACALAGGERIAIGAQTEREEPHRLIMLLFRPSWSIQQIFEEAAGGNAPLEEILDNYFSPLVEVFAPGGVIVGIIRSEEIHIQSFGLVSEDQLFEVGSVTKPFTGLLLAEMVSRGEVTLEDPARAYFPDDVRFPKDAAGQDIRLLDLVTHSAGLPRLPPDWEPANPLDPYADFVVGTLYASLAKVVLDVPIGSIVRYSNYGFAILGHALSRAVHSDYSKLVLERVCQPLEMNDSGVAFGKQFPHRRARGYGLSGNEMTPWLRPVFAPAGGIETTIGDLTRFVRAQLSAHTTPLATPIEETQIPRIASEENAYMGLAWQIAGLADGGVCIWHSGQTGGFSSSIIFHPSTGTGVAAVSNTTSHRLDQHTATILATLAKS